MGAYKRNVVVAIKMSAYIHGVLILCGCPFMAMDLAVLGPSRCSNCAVMVQK